jgi:uncharacterized protein YidB (DUF937 family)
MANPILEQILGSVLGRAGGNTGPWGTGGLESVLGGMLGGGAPAGRPTGIPQGGGALGGRNALLALLLPLALQWIQRNGGIGNVLQRVNQRGFGGQAASWIGTGQNEAMPLDAVHQVVGNDALAAMSQQLGVGEDEVAQGFAEILPEVVDRLSPAGEMPADADQRLDAGQSALDRMLAGLR